MLTAEEEADLIRAAQAGDKRAVERLVRAFRPLLGKMAARHARNGRVLFEDLIHEAIIGFMIALEKFDLSRGVRFATYLPFHVRTQLQDRYGHMAGVVTAKMKPSEAIKAAQLREEITAEERATGKAVPQKRRLEMARSRGMNGKALSRLTVSEQAPTDLDAIVELADPAADMSEQVLARHSMQKVAPALSRALAQLSERDRDIVRRSIIKGESLQSIGPDYGRTGERIRQWRIQALAKLRTALAEAGVENLSDIHG